MQYDWKGAKWIGADRGFPSPVIERRITMRQPVRGILRISALGFFLVYVNGRRVGTEYYLPSNSLFRERKMEGLLYPLKDQFTYRCYYSEYEISEYLKEGENLLEIRLGDGWYRQTDRVAEGNMAFGDQLGVIYSIELTDAFGRQRIDSDGTEQCRSSEITYSQLFYGECHDARIVAGKQYQYLPVTLLADFETILSPEDTAPDRIVRQTTPKLLLTERLQPKEGAGKIRRLYDAGENISGFVTLRVNAKEGEEVRIRFAEELDGTKLDYRSAGSGYISPDGRAQIMEDVFIGDGKEHLFEPLFVWHAFRYFEVIGDGEAVRVDVVHSDVTVTSSFASGSKELDWLYQAFLRTQLNNMHGGVPSDCPHRERLGYTGDGQIAAQAAMEMLDGKAFYRKWICDIFDSQDKVSGHVNHTAPFAGGGGGPGGWGCAAILVPYYYYLYYGDVTVPAQYYEQMKQWITYLETHSENGLVVREEEGGWCLGDWCTPEPVRIPEAYVNTCYLIRSLQMLEELAENMEAREMAGEEELRRENRAETKRYQEDIRYMKALRKRAELAVREAYYDPATGSFADGEQGADAFALYAGLGDERSLQNLLARYRGREGFDTGFLGTDILCEVLFRAACSEEGHQEAADIAYKLLTGHAPGTFGYMMDRGATTIWESWDGGGSLDHPMFGAAARQLFSGILGIRQRQKTAGYRDLIISPCLPGLLKEAGGSRMLPAGRISVRWKREAAWICFVIEIPEGVAAEFCFGKTKKKLQSGRNEFTINRNG